MPDLLIAEALEQSDLIYDRAAIDAAIAGMAAAHAAGGVQARIHAHLDAGCDVVLVCHPELVEDALQAVQGRRLNTAALAGLIGRGALGWDGLLADAGYQAARSRLPPASLA